MSDTPVVLLNGARQTGKTTLAQELAAAPGVRYFTLDDAATLALAANDPSGFIRNLSGPVGFASPRPFQTHFFHP
jgi:predicted AAA+ superfamily ATPase